MGPRTTRSCDRQERADLLGRLLCLLLGVRRLAHKIDVLFELGLLLRRLLRLGLFHARLMEPVLPLLAHLRAAETSEQAA